MEIIEEGKDSQKKEHYVNIMLLWKSSRMKADQWDEQLIDKLDGEDSKEQGK